jgi:hypothetical protein
MGDDRPLRYLDPDGTVVYRASGLGVCDGIVLGLARGRRPNAIPEWLQEVYDEGHRMEDVIIGELTALDEYEHLHLDSQTEWTLEIGEINDRLVIVRGHSDGWDITAETIVEAKKFRPSTWPKFQRQAIECNPLYPWQASVYMHAARQLGIEAQLLFVGGAYHPADEVFAESIEEIGVFQYGDPPLPLNAIRRRIVRWERMIEEGLDVTDIDECTPKQYPCAMFGKGCPGESKADEALELTGAWADKARPIIETLSAKQSIIKTANEMIKAADAHKKKAQADLLAVFDEMVEAGVVSQSPKKVTLDGVTISHVTGDVPEKVTKGYALNYLKIN